MLRIGSLSVVLVVVLLAGCQSEPPEPDAQARAACVFWEAHVARLFSPEIIVVERRDIAEEFLALAEGSQTRGFSEAARNYAAGTAVIPEGSQRDFDRAVDHISRVCDVPRPEYAGRRTD